MLEAIGGERAERVHRCLGQVGSHSGAVPMECGDLVAALAFVCEARVTSVALTEVYPRLGSWIRRCKEKSSDGGYLETILKRRFRRAHAKNELAVLNFT